MNKRRNLLKKKTLCLTLAFVLFCTGCAASGSRENPDETGGSTGISEEETIPNLLDSEVEAEAEGCFRYFWELVQLEEDSGAYGMVRDRYPGARNVASIASTGFGLAAIPYGVYKGGITEAEGYERAEKTLDTLLALDHAEGFLYHFVNMLNGHPGTGSEISSVDTGILLCGALVAGEYFGNTVKEKAMELYGRVDWEFFLDPSRNLFYMAYSPEDGFSGYWDVYAEQLMLYVLGAGSPTHPVDRSVYYAFQRLKGKYGEYEFIHSWFGSIFTYQYSHAFIDFRGLVDEKGTDWYQNSVTASLAARQFCIDRQDTSETYHENSWGLTACDTPDGYNGLQGAPPSGTDNQAHESSGTIAPSGAIGSMPFMPEESTAALKNYMSYPDFLGEYGLKNAYNLDKGWFDTDYVGIDKGISLLMIANYECDFVWNLFMGNECVRQGLENLGFTESTENIESAENRE